MALVTPPDRADYDTPPSNGVFGGDVFDEPSFYPPSGEMFPPLDRQTVLDLADDLSELNDKDGDYEASERVRELVGEILETESIRAGFDVTEGSKYVIVTRRGNGREASLGRAIEARVFADRFERTTEEVESDYDPYDEASDFLICIDAKRKLPVGAIRITTNGPLGMPDFNVLAIADEVDNYEREPVAEGLDPYNPLHRGATKLDDEGNPIIINPWFDELRERYKYTGEDLSEVELLQRAMFAARFNDRARSASTVNVNSILDRTLNVATMSVLTKYSRGQSIPGPATALYNGVLRIAKQRGAVFLAAIQDETPFHLLNAFGSPFKELGLSHRSFGGPFNTIPSFCDLRTALLRMERDPDMGESARFLIEKDISEAGDPLEEEGYAIFPFEANGWWAGRDEYGRNITPTNGNGKGKGNGKGNGTTMVVPTKERIGDRN